MRLGHPTQPCKDCHHRQELMLGLNDGNLLVHRPTLCANTATTTRMHDTYPPIIVAVLQEDKVSFLANHGIKALGSGA